MDGRVLLIAGYVCAYMYERYLDHGRERGREKEMRKRERETERERD